MTDLKTLTTIANKTAAYEKKAGAKNVFPMQNVYDELVPLDFKILGFNKKASTTVLADFKKAPSLPKEMKALGFTQVKYHEKTALNLQKYDPNGDYKLAKGKNGEQCFQSQTFAGDTLEVYKNKQGQTAIVNTTIEHGTTSRDISYY